MDLKGALKEVYKVAERKYQFENTPKLILRHNQANANNILGQTAYYNPSSMTIVLFITDRHPKDICRSFSHELVHHHQKEICYLEIGKTGIKIIERQIKDKYFIFITK